jgi:hypothetical protein
MPRHEDDQEQRWPADRFVGFQFSEEQFPPDQFLAGGLSAKQMSPEQLSQDQLSPGQCSADVSLSGRRSGARRGGEGESLMGTARLATPGTVAAAVPYFFGFQIPTTNSMVLI